MRFLEASIFLNFLYLNLSHQKPTSMFRKHTFTSLKSTRSSHFLFCISISFLAWISSLGLFLVKIGVEFNALFEKKEYAIESVLIGFQIILPLLLFCAAVILFLTSVYRRLYTLLDRKRYLWVYYVFLAVGLLFFFYGNTFFTFYLLLTIVLLGSIPTKKFKTK